MGFQTQVNNQPAPAVAGDYASANPRAVMLAGPGALVAGNTIPQGEVVAGVLVGRFAWTSAGSATNPNSGEVDGAVTAANTGTGAPDGFVHREQQALITQFLSESSNLVPHGLPLTLHVAGDFWAVNDGPNTSYKGQSVYALNANGKAVPADSAPTDATLTTITVVANKLGAGPSAGSVAPNAFHGYIAGTTLTVTTVNTGGMYPNQIITSGAAAGTYIVKQLTGTAGAAGTYQVSINQNVGSSGTPSAFTGSGGWMTVVSMASGVILVGMVMSGGTNAFTAGTTVLAGGTGTGGAGTYPVSIAQTLADISNATGNGAYMNVTAVTGTLNVNDTLTTGGAHTGTVMQQVSGTTGGIGAYWISNAAAIGDTSGAVYSGTLTKWKCMSVSAPGELFKMSSYPLG